MEQQKNPVTRPVMRFSIRESVLVMDTYHKESDKSTRPKVKRYKLLLLPVCSRTVNVGFPYGVLGGPGTATCIARDGAAEPPPLLYLLEKRHSVVKFACNEPSS